MLRYNEVTHPGCVFHSEPAIYWPGQGQELNLLWHHRLFFLCGSFLAFLTGMASKTVNEKLVICAPLTSSPVEFQPHGVENTRLSHLSLVVWETDPDITVIVISQGPSLPPFPQLSR